MSALIRDAPIGQVIRWATNNRYLKYPEERDDFEVPVSYVRLQHVERKSIPTLSSTDDETPATEPEGPAIEATYPDPETILEQDNVSEEDQDGSDLEKIQTARTNHTARTQISRVGTKTALQKSISRADLEQQFSLASIERGPSRPIEPEQLHDGTILVDWYTTDDAENPKTGLSARKVSYSRRS